MGPLGPLRFQTASVLLHPYEYCFMLWCLVLFSEIAFFFYVCLWSFEETPKRKGDRIFFCLLTLLYTKENEDHKWIMLLSEKSRS